MKKTRSIIILIVAIALVAVGLLMVYRYGLFGYSYEDLLYIITGESHDYEDDAALEVYFIDVGQADSILLVTPSNKTMLVDAGEPDSFDAISSQLGELGIERLDIVVATHPHADHIGSMTKVINNYEIGAFYMTDFTSNTRTYERMLDALEQRGVTVYQALAGTYMPWDEQVELSILSPIEGIDPRDNNNSSVVLKVVYGQSSLLLTGDAEKYVEKDIIQSFGEEILDCDVLKLGHHGSSTSSSKDFLLAVSPDIAICSLGKDNDYGHPHKETVERLNKLGIPMYRTDELGTIVLYMGYDGEIKMR